MADREDGTVLTPNPSEQFVADRLKEKGFTVVKDGWPDFLVVKDGEFWLMEVKPDEGHRKLSPSQQRMADALRSVGILVNVVTPEDVS